MNTLNKFDVLVVYSDCIAKSAGNSDINNILPFSNTPKRGNYNNAYSYFLKTCETAGLKAAFSTSGDIIDAGTCKSFWVFEENKWKKVYENCYSEQIFDKFSPKSKKSITQRELLFSSELIKPFNNPNIVSLFFDKYKTYKKLIDFAIPTVIIDDLTLSGVKKSIQKLRRATNKHIYKYDFTNEIIVKDRYGSGGNNIYKISKNFSKEIHSLVDGKKRLSFIIQPFMKFENGFTYKNNSAATDIRLIYQNGKIIQTYIRTAKTNDFRCNEHQGGSLFYVNLEDIPQKVLDFSEIISNELKHKKSLFALDYLISDIGNVFLLEGNTGPGIDWNITMKKNEQMSKALIHGIVEEFSSRIAGN